MDGTLYYRTRELLAGPVSIGVGGQVVLGPNDLLRCLHYPSTFFLYRNGVEDGSVSNASLILYRAKYSHELFGLLTDGNLRCVLHSYMLHNPEAKAVGHSRPKYGTGMATSLSYTSRHISCPCKHCPDFSRRQARRNTT